MSSSLAEGRGASAAVCCLYCAESVVYSFAGLSSLSSTALSRATSSLLVGSIVAKSDHSSARSYPYLDKCLLLYLQRRMLVYLQRLVVAKESTSEFAVASA